MPVTPPTFSELYDAGKTEVTLRDSTLTNFREGSNLDALVGAMALLASIVLDFVLRTFRKHYLADATGEDLDVQIARQFGPDLLRKTDVKAVGEIIWVPALGTPYTIPAGTLVTGIDSAGLSVAAYTIESAVSTDGTPIAVEAANSGPAGNYAAGVLTTPTFPFDSGASVIQPSRLAGGSDIEADEDLRARAALHYQTFEAATERALLRAALSTRGVSYAAVDVIYTATRSQVRVFVADAGGSASETLRAQADANIQAASGLGPQTTTFAAIEQLSSITLHTEFFAGVDTIALKDVAETVARAYLNSTPTGRPWVASELHRTLLNAMGERTVYDVQVVFANGSTTKFFPSDKQRTLRVPTESGITLVATEVTE